LQLIFVYNANSGLVDKWLDTAHKIIDPKNYSCSLCALTHGNFNEKKAWKNFRENTSVPMRFLYKDTFVKQYQSKWLPNYEFPVVLLESHNELELFIPTEELASYASLDDLIVAIQQRLAVD